MPRVCAVVTRANTGQLNRPSASANVTELRPRTATKVTARTRDGNAMVRSTIRSKVWRIHRDVSAESKPRPMPIAALIRVARAAIPTVCFAPMIKRNATSRPRPSVPSRWLSVRGGSRRRDRSRSLAHCSKRSGETMLVTISTNIARRDARDRSFFMNIESVDRYDGWRSQPTGSRQIRVLLSPTPLIARRESRATKLSRVADGPSRANQILSL